MRKARPFQYQQFESVRDAFRKGQKGVIVEAPTGTGKAVSIALITKMVQDKGGKVLILVNRDILVTQLIEELKEIDVFASREQAEERASLTSEVVVASIQSMGGTWLTKWPATHFRLVILDECHSSGARTIKRVLSHFENCYHVGFTATPERHDKTGLWAGYKDIAFSMTLKEAMDEGWLVPFDFVDLDCPVVLSEKLMHKATFTESEEVFDSSKYLPRLAECAIAESQGRKGIFFLPNCRVSNEFTKMLRDGGLNAEHIDSSYMPANETKRLLAWFKAQETAILCNADLLSVGVNIPTVDLIGLFRPIASTPMYKQRLGRGTRPIAPVDNFDTAEARREAIASSAKPSCKVLNVFWENGDHDLASPACLITDDREEQKELNKGHKLGQKIDLADLELKLKASKEMKDQAEEMRKFAEKVANSQQRKHKGAVWIDDILKTRDGGESASEKQYGYLYFLSKKNFRSENLTKKQASRIIGRYQPQKANV